MLRKAKKGLCIVLSAVISMSLMAGCGEKTASDELLYYVTGTEKGDTAEILDLVSQKVAEETGISVRFEFLNNNNYDLALSSGDEFDLITAPDWLNYWQNAAKGAFAEISDEDLKKYVPYIWENGGDTLNVTTYKGTRYGIANLHRYASDRCIVARGDLMDKYGIESLDSIEAIEKYLDAVKANEPDMIPFDVTSGSPYNFLSMFASDWGWAPVGSLSYGEHIYFNLNDPEHKLFIAAEQPEMKIFTETMKRWNDKGFFSKSVLSNKTPVLDSFKAGRTALSWVSSPVDCQNLWDELSADDRASWDIRFTTRSRKYQQMYNYTNGIVAVSAFSKNKEAALKVVNEMYQNKEIYDLMHFGVKDRHFKVDEEGYYQRTAETDNAGYVSSGIFNDALEYKTKLTFPGNEELVKKLEDMRVVNPAVNCPVSDEGIREIKLALTEVYQKYTGPRCYGVINGTVDEALATEIKALKTAGIDKYIQNIQLQLDEYLAGLE